MNLQLLLRWGSPTAAALPRAPAEALADAAGDLAHRLAPGARRVLARNLELVLAAPPSEAAVRGAFRTYARYFLGTMRLARGGLRRAVGDVRWENPEMIAASLRHGRGAVVLSGHVGHWDVLGSALAGRFGETCLLVELLRPAPLYEFYTTMRRRQGVAVAPVSDPGRLPIAVLGRNGILGAAVDRPFGLRCAPARCGEAMLSVPTGAIRFGLRHGAALHAVFAIRTPSGFTLRAGPDWGPQLRGVPDEAARLQQAAALFAAALRAVVVQHPDQWCLFQPLEASASLVARDAA